jgi:glycosyltransferase involved in cell wall biosynthesis
MIIYVCCIVLQCGYVFFFFIRFFFIRSVLPAQPPEASMPVSVIICARNEASRLQHNLPEILAQRYTNESGKPHFEVVVVDDASTDDTAAVLEGLATVYAHLRVVRIAPDAVRDLPGKKFALRAGMQQAAHEWLLMTDADCRPSGPGWITYMTAPLRSGKEIVAGYAPYAHRSGLLNAFVRWETMHTLLQYAGYARAGLPYMAVGRNLACTATVLHKAVKTPLWGIIPSGDDDLLMRIAADKHNTAVVADPEAFMISPAKDSWAAWLRQKQRHMSTGKYYRRSVQLLLGVYALSHAAAWLLAILLLFSIYAWAVAGLMALRCVLYWGLWLITARKLKEQRLARFFPFFDFGWMIYNFVLAPYILWKNKHQWT